MELKGTTNENMARLRYGYRDLATDKQDTFVLHLDRLESGWEVLVEGEGDVAPPRVEAGRRGKKSPGCGVLDPGSALQDGRPPGG